MLSSVFTKTLWERRRSLIWWSVGVLALVGMTAGFYPALADQQETYSQLFESFEGFASVFGVDEISQLTEPEGYLNSQLYSNILSIVMLVFAIGVGTAALAGEEDRRTMDLLLAHPVSRHRVVIDKFAAMATLTAVLSALTLVLLLLLNGPTELDIGFGGLLAATVGMALMALFFGTLALAVGGVTGRRGLTIGISAAVAVAAFFFFGFAPLIEQIEWTRVLSPFHWFLGGRPLTEGFGPMYLTLGGGILLLLGIALWGFNRRDVSV